MIVLMIKFKQSFYYKNKQYKNIRIMCSFLFYKSYFNHLNQILFFTIRCMYKTLFPLINASPYLD